MGRERRLYYRELIARFGHHLALNWNLDEENGKWGNERSWQTTEQRKALAQYFWDHDPYRHLVVIHNGQSSHDLLGDESELTGVSVQTSRPDFSLVPGAVLNWVRRSTDAGKPWVVACDEPGDHRHGLIPDDEDPTRDHARMSSSHVGFCALRLEPIWMSLGQAAGHAAALAVLEAVTVQEVPVPLLQRRLYAGNPCPTHRGPQDFSRLGEAKELVWRLGINRHLQRLHLAISSDDDDVLPVGVGQVFGAL